MSTMTSKETLPGKARSWEMFDAISPRYDLLNRILSFGQHLRWRRKLAAYLPARPGLKVLDLATGTADVLLALCTTRLDITVAQGMDLAEQMLAIGRRKVELAGKSGLITLSNGDAARIPSHDNTFDAVTMAFGIRNVENPVIVLKEIFRVLKPGGRAIILEFSLPGNALVRLAVIGYLRLIPVLGWLFSGNFHAYRYLNQTIEKFPYGEIFCRMLQQVGLRGVGRETLMWGAATIYYGEKV